MLENLLSSTLLFAERSALGRLPASPAGSSLPLLIGLGLTALVVMALIVGFIQYRQRRNNRGALNSPTELWAELCRLHQLDKSDSAALRELAEVRTIVPAASVFVRADLWQLENDSAEIRPLRAQLQRLQSVLFAAPQQQPRSVRL